ncbi:hypothetical protein CSX02_03035, partial [Agathobacter ruminis]
MFKMVEYICIKYRKLRGDIIMLISLKNLYERFNQFGKYYSYSPIMKSATMAKIYRDYSGKKIDIEQYIKILEKPFWDVEKGKEQLFFDSNTIQPKSTGFRLILLRVVLDAIPNSVYEKMAITKSDVLGITHAITLYYLGKRLIKRRPIKISRTLARIA